MNLALKISGFVKLEHTLFSLPLLFSGALLAIPPRALQAEHGGKLGLILLAGVGARTLALALNRLIDRKIDARNPRTKSRELPSGRLTAAQGWLIACAGGALYLWAAWKLGDLCLKLSPLPIAVFALYPLMKRFTWTAHFGVGLGLALAPLGGWIGMVNAWPSGISIWLLSAFTLLWVAGFDILYAVDDLEFDQREGLHSIPAMFGEKAARLTSQSLHVSCVVLILAMALTMRMAALLGGSAPHPAIAYGAVVPVVVLMLLQQKFSNSLEPGSAFFRVNAWTGVAVFVFVFAGVS